MKVHSALLLGAIAAVSAQTQTPTIEIACPETTDQPNYDVSCVRVGMTYPKTGFFAEEGEWHERGTDLWAREVNSRGVWRNNTGARPRRFYVALTAYNDFSNKTLTVELYEQMAGGPNFDVFLGPFASSRAEAVKPVTNTFDKVIVQANAAADDVYSTEFPNLFGMSTSTEFYTDSALTLLEDRDAKTASLLRSNNFFTKATSDGIINTLARLGYTLDGEYEYDEDLDDASKRVEIDRFIDLMAGNNSDVLISATPLADGPLVVEELYGSTYRPKAVILGSAGTDQGKVTEMGDQAEGLLSYSQWQPQESYEGEFFGTSRAWANLYEDRYGDELGFPSHYSASACAAGVVLMHAIVRTDDFTNTTQLVEQLNAVDMLTFFGPVNFDDRGRNLGKPMITTQVKNGLVQVVAPLDQADVVLKYPLFVSASNALKPSMWMAALGSVAAMASLVVL